MIVPSIDIMNGKAVQLVQGRRKVLERSDVLELARKFGRYGEIAVIDLDAALGKGSNLELIKEICKLADCRVGGGIRTTERAEEVLRAGAKKIIIGTKATPDFLSKLPKDRIIVAVDAKDEYVMNRGWRKQTEKKPQELVTELEDYCSSFLFTDIGIEGSMKGCDFEKIEKLGKLTDKKITAAGGISSVGEIKRLDDLGFDSQLGMSIYTGKINLTEAFLSILDFERNDGMIPTIVQEANRQVLMIAFSTPESLKRSLETGKATYYSRSRKKLWTKGDTSGNSQELLRVKYDCDRDALLFTVRQKGVACHMNRYSCFGDKEFSLDQLYDVLSDRILNPKNGSYTSKISKKEEIIMAKIKEECGEIIDYNGKDNLIREIADLTYFVMLLMAKKGIMPSDVMNELWRRRK